MTIRLLSNITNSELIHASKQRVYSKKNSSFLIKHLGETYQLIFQIMSSEHYIKIGMIPEYFQSGIPICVILRSLSGENEIKCFICFHDISQIQPSMTYVPTIEFSLCIFEKDLIDIRFAMKSEIHSPSFALGCFNVRSFIQQFRWVSSNEWRIPFLSRSLFRSLREIGYFDFFDYNHFMSIVFNLFQRMFSLNGKILHVRPDVLKELFFSFIQKLLMNNSRFIICGEFIHPIRPSRSLIRLFSNPQNPPVVNFIDDNLGLVGLSYLSCVGGDFQVSFAAVSITTTKFIEIGSENRKWYPDIGDESRNDNINDDSSGPLKRTPAYSKPKYIKQGITPFGNHHLIVFITGFSINIFIRRPNGTFEHFNIWFFVLLHALDIDKSLHEATIQFTEFRYIGTSNFGEGLEQCGVRAILEGTASVEEIYHFFYQSDFGVVLQSLWKNFQECLNEHYSIKYSEEKNPNQKKRLIEYRCDTLIQFIRSNRFIKELVCFLTPVLKQVQQRRYLPPEILEILQFLKELFAFFTPAPLALDM
jgi:hypothetical protein